MTTPAYSLQQQTFALSILSNDVSGIKNSTAAALAVQLQSDVTTALASDVFRQFLGSSWSLVWGPAVSVQNTEGIADNAIFVAHDPSQNVYVVAMSGTNPVSSVDLRVEDLEVNPLVPFHGAASITTGTSDGVAALESLQDPSTGATLQQFLNGPGIVSGSMLIFTGHSLGGALAPALPLDLIHNQGFDGNSFSEMLVYPTAGPSVGDAGYAQLFLETFAAQPAAASAPAYESWNLAVWNSLDVVPHAWTMLGAVPTLYGPHPPACVETVLTWVTNCVLQGTVLTQLQNAMFTGTKQDFPLLFPMDAFVAQMLYQHVAAYYAEIVPNLPFKVPGQAVVAAVAAALSSFCAGNPNAECRPTG